MRYRCTCSRALWVAAKAQDKSSFIPALITWFAFPFKIEKKPCPAKLERDSRKGIAKAKCRWWWRFSHKPQDRFAGGLQSKCFPDVCDAKEVTETVTSLSSLFVNVAFISVVWLQACLLAFFKWSSLSISSLSRILTLLFNNQSQSRSILLPSSTSSPVLPPSLNFLSYPITQWKAECSYRKFAGLKADSMWSWILELHHWIFSLKMIASVQTWNAISWAYSWFH